MKETQIQKDIIDYLTVNGWFVWKNKNVNRNTGIYLPTQQRGVADLTAIRKGIVIFIEIKTENGTQSTDQKIFEQEIKKHGGSYYILRSEKEAQILHEFITTLRL